MPSFKPALALLAIVVACSALARDARVPRAFKKAHPCPATGRHYGPCPGWIIDHIVPLCAGGPDRVSNLQWQTTADAKIKDRTERRLCRTHGKKL